MTIIRLHRYCRADLQANPDVLFVFGDNDARVGLGGQAGEARGEPNAVGVRTKRTPGSAAGDFFSDDALDFNIALIDEDMTRITTHLANGGIVVYPSDGVGTGLSEMPTRCPRTFEYLRSIGLGGAP